MRLIPLSWQHECHRNPSNKPPSCICLRWRDVSIRPLAPCISVPHAIFSRSIHCELSSCDVVRSPLDKRTHTQEGVFLCQGPASWSPSVRPASPTGKSKRASSRDKHIVDDATDQSARPPDSAHPTFQTRHITAGAYGVTGPILGGEYGYYVQSAAYGLGHLRSARNMTTAGPHSPSTATLHRAPTASPPGSCWTPRPMSRPPQPPARPRTSSALARQL